MRLFRKRTDEDKRPDWLAEALAAREAAYEAARKAGPEQPCMSEFMVDHAMSTYRQCQTGIPAGVPHEHRTVDGFWGRRTAVWGTGRGNPFEDYDRDRADREWLEAAPRGKP